ncbi:CsbD family protein [Sphingomonas sp.]|uniref:CsbD family protein n=1 Tax=Sphingomonas sp. TaxID=28214 RepID=UPI00325FCE3A
MGEFTDKIKGAVNNAVGNAKQESDNPQTRAEGERQELKGDVQETKGKIKGAINDL